MNRIVPIILILLGLCLDVQAQKGLAIGAAFDELAVKKNVTEVVVGAGRLKKYHLSLYHSLEVRNPSATERERMEELLRKDAQQAVLREESSGHKLYELPSRKGMHYYIFYRNSSQSLILIYIEGKASLKQIESYFRK